jgi:hypothetical protein
MKMRRALVVAVSLAISCTSIAVSAPRAGAAGTFSPSTLASQTAHIGTPFSASLSYAAGSTFSVTSGQVPPGLSLNVLGQITGVPTQAGAYTFVVQAKSVTGTGKKAYTILVNLATATGYDARMHSVIFARDATPPPGVCNQTGYVSYAIADLWLERNPADVNAKMAALRFSHFGGDPSACSSHSDQARNNLMLSLLLRPYFLYNPASSWFPGRLTSAASNNLVAQMWTYASQFAKATQAADPWSIFDSENHDAQAESFYFLSAQIFKNLPGYKTKHYADHHTPAQEYAAWRAHWNAYFDSRAKNGLLIEVGAPTYNGYTLSAIANIYDFAEDPILRKKAGMMLDLIFADYAQQNYQGILAGAKSRSYPVDSPNGNDDSITNINNLLFGSASSIPADNHVLTFATSGYSPPPVVTGMGRNHAGMGTFTYVTRRPGNGAIGPDGSDNWHVDTDQSVLNYAYVTPDYEIGTAELKPGQRHIAPSSQNRWQGIVFNAGGQARIYPQAAPSNVSPTNDAFLSVQKTNVLITEKQNYTDHPTLVYFPPTLNGLVARGGWLFARQGGAYVAVRPALGSYHWLTSAKNKASSPTQRFIALTDGSSPIIFEAGRAPKYKTFAAFENRILKNALSHTNKAVNYRGSDGTRFTMFLDPSEAPRINNIRPTYEPRFMLDSPFVKSVWNSGKITIKRGSQSATYDFSARNNPRKVVK